jgi:hypothetical protein
MLERMAFQTPTGTLFVPESLMILYLSWNTQGRRLPMGAGLPQLSDSSWRNNGLIGGRVGTGFLLHALSLAREGQTAAELEAKRLSGELQGLNASSRHASNNYGCVARRQNRDWHRGTAESVKAEHIQRLQAEKTKAEEEWLDAKLEAENAEAAMVKAERKADDLARRNRHLAVLLRKTGFHSTSTNPVPRQRRETRIWGWRADKELHSNAPHPPAQRRPS